MKSHKERPYKPTLELPQDEELPELTTEKKEVQALSYEIYAKLGLLSFFGLMTVVSLIIIVVFIVKSFPFWACLLFFVILMFFIIGLLMMVDNLFPSTLPKYLEGILNGISKILSIFKPTKDK